MLENKCRTCGRDLDSGFNCPVCSNKTMKTPTKEQIEEIMRNALEGKTFPIPTWELITKCITEWEKIRS